MYPCSWTLDPSDGFCPFWLVDLRQTDRAAAIDRYSPILVYAETLNDAYAAAYRAAEQRGMGETPYRPLRLQARSHRGRQLPLL